MLSANKGLRVVVVALAILFSASAAAEPLKPGGVYYFEDFDPAMKPWSPGEGLNFEEVFKNYIYYEVVVGKAGREITVNRYTQNTMDRSDKYLIRPDGSLEAK